MNKNRTSFVLKPLDGSNAFKQISIQIYHLMLVVNACLLQLGVQKSEEMELFVIASKLILIAIKTDPYTFYGSEDFRDYNQHFLENIHNHLDLE